LAALALGDLPLPHKDPFDRQLLALCCCDGMTLVTRDRTLTKYDVHFVLAGREHTPDGWAHREGHA
jgi:PIN domain nuclease of toxin-antitoxin system